MSGKKLLYVMGIDWEWIYQRPQIIERHLETKYDVTVIFPRSILHFFHKPTGTYPQKYHILWTLPFQEKISAVGRIAGQLSKKAFKNLNQYDAIVIGYPLYYRYIPSSYPGRIIYDCMDNHEMLYPCHRGADKLVREERRLLAACEVLFASGQKLAEKVFPLTKNNICRKLLVRNGCMEEIYSVPMAAKISSNYKIGYFGTISDWFDYDILFQSVNQDDEVEYHLFGPVQKKCSKLHERIILEGICRHEGLYEAVKDCVCLIMPFKVNQIVEWVDPVKLYEYIAMGKCIISVWYEEIDRFQDFVYFYTDVREYMQLLEYLKARNFLPKYSASQQAFFLENNSWRNRFHQIDNALEIIGE